jgi:plastocyanin
LHAYYNYHYPFEIDVMSKIDDPNELSRYTNGFLNIRAATMITDEAKYVSMVRDAAYIGNKAFSPNPIDIKVGDAITWTK